MGKKNYGSYYEKLYQRYRYLLNNLKEYYNRDYSIMIPNALDGQHVFTSIRRGNKVTCHESNDVLTNGGSIGYFNVIKLKPKLKYFSFEDKAIIHYKNFMNKEF